MTRNQLLNEALFDRGGTVDGIKFGPLSAPARTLLTAKGNPMFGGDRGESGDFDTGEILLVLSLGSDGRAKAFIDSAADWSARVNTFIVGLPDKAIESFLGEYLIPAIERHRLAMTESGGPGKPEPTRAISPITSKARKRPASKSSRKQ